MLPSVLPASQPGLQTWPPQKLRWKQPEQVEFHSHVIVAPSVTFAAATSSVSSRYSAGTWLAWTSLFTGARAACSPAWKCYQKSDNVRLLKQLQTISKQQKSDYVQHFEQLQTISTTIVWFNIFKLFLLNTSAAAKSSANSALAAATFGDHNFLLRAIQSYKSFKRKPLKSNVPSTNLDTKTWIHYKKKIKLFHKH